jgi:hypothetical protein
VLKFKRKFRRLKVNILCCDNGKCPNKDKIWDTGDFGGERTNWNRVGAIDQECDRRKDLRKSSITIMGGTSLD